jgi:hypothetical protein
MIWSFSDRRRELKIAFLERNAEAVDPADAHGTILFETLHRRTLEQLVDDFNKSNPEFRLCLLPPDPLPTREETKSKSYLIDRYKRLEKQRDLAVVFDNCWGKDIADLAQQIRTFPAPIVFLNADRNGLDFGDARLFVGSSDQVPAEICVILPKLLCPNGLVAKADFLFVTEDDYALKDTFQKTLEQQQNLPPAAIIELPGHDGKGPANRLELARAKSLIVAKYLRGDEWDGMQKRPKVLILNSHSIWGRNLVSWLDATFQNLTVIGYQSLLSRTPGFTFGSNNNELVLLSFSSQTIPEVLFLRFRNLQRNFPEAFARPDAVFFVRRCVVAMELLSAALNGRHWPDVQPGSRFQSQLSFLWKRYRGGTLRTSAGLYRFSAEGDLLGQNYFLSYRNGTLSAYPLQVIYRQEESQKREPMPNVHVGFRDLRIRDISIDSGTFRAEFDYWLRDRESKSTADASTPSDATLSASPSTSPTLQLVDFKPDAGTETTLGALGQRLLATTTVGVLRQRTFHVSGTFSASLNGRTYPFDHHRLRIELQAWNPDNQLHVSTEQLTKQPEVDGWSVGDDYVALHSRETNPALPLSSFQTSESSQFDTISISIDVRRNLWNAFLLIVFPLGLLVLASVAVLFIKFTEDKSGTTDGVRTEKKDSEAPLENRAINMPAVPVRVADEIIMSQLRAAPYRLVSVAREVSVFKKRIPNPKLLKYDARLWRKAFANPSTFSGLPCHN